MTGSYRARMRFPIANLENLQLINIFLLLILPWLVPGANIVERLVVPPVRAILGLFLLLVGLGPA